MRNLTSLCLFVVLSSFTAVAQVLPSSNGSCRVTASGLESCNWMSAVTRISGSIHPAHSVHDATSALFVTHYILAPGAPLSPAVEGVDVFIVSMSNGELQNEKAPSQSTFPVSNGFVMLMPKQEPFLLRNVGKEKLELLVFEVRE